MTLRMRGGESHAKKRMIQTLTMLGQSAAGGVRDRKSEGKKELKKQGCTIGNE